ncbi:MAG: peptidase T [Spirochaetales bacterium]|jgi:tripeptide aminopeptidase|nr:peptidase T [Spirochaetales bacterium]
MTIPQIDKQHLTHDILERFLRYVKIDTQSDETGSGKPTTPGQWNLLNLIQAELKEAGISDIFINDDGFMIARMPSNISGSQPPAIGFMAHVDTAGDMPGKNVKPQIITDYDGTDIRLGDSWLLRVDENPQLLDWKGQSIITSDGTTLLGADDKAGAAEIVAAAKYLAEHPDIRHGEVEFIFTCDEETGHGMDGFPLEQLHSACCYTLDGGKRGEIEYECFHAVKALITFTGVMYHPGSARGRMVNAITMAASFCGMLPQAESPEATDGRYGYYYFHALSGDSEKCNLIVNLRDFEQKGMERRQQALQAAAEAVEFLYQGGIVSVEFEKQYANMRSYIEKAPKVMQKLTAAVAELGIEPILKPIRGGTDGSRLSEMGIPAPNIFAGGVNFHSRYEWAALPAMRDAALVILGLVRSWSTEQA